MQVSPNELKVKTLSEKDNTGVFSFEPLPMGFGNTLGNTLRRVLLTSLKGAAVTQVKIAGVDHQFSTLQGVKEDIVELTLNLKKIRVKSHSEDPVVLMLNKKGPGEITAGDIETSAEVEILNKDLHIATFSDKSATLKAELVVETGIGYSPMEERQSSKIGVIILDAIYSPVLRAFYTVESTRFGKLTNLDKLTLTVETDGSIAPSAAVMETANLLSDFFRKVAEWTVAETEVLPEAAATTSTGAAMPSDNIMIEELPLPTRTVNALKKQGIDTLGQLAKKSNEELADIKNLGEKSVNEIKKLLKKEGYRAE
ncbi:MAG TPA: DNA-directed RNA polymerase subunit alpha [Candidatus Saccharimonadales bacterium]|nr:DNA-directed RNA polymerase subunit alpha [Candidatus Saccharimonadales bacterium]